MGYHILPVDNHSFVDLIVNHYDPSFVALECTVPGRPTIIHKEGIQVIRQRTRNVWNRGVYDCHRRNVLAKNFSQKAIEHHHGALSTAADQI